MVYNILDYGAKADGTLCTNQIQKAINDCFLDGGGEVIIPCGVFLTGGLRLRSGVITSPPPSKKQSLIAF